MKKFIFIILMLIVITASLLIDRKKLFLKCPESINISDFQPSLYTGRWYEVAYKDVAQFKICKCFKVNFSQVSQNNFNFDYAVQCPGKKGYSDYTVHSSVTKDAKISNLLLESVAGLIFNNNIVKVYRKPDGASSSKNLPYDRAIQFQCKEAFGINLYIGFNLLSRNPVIQEEELDEMIRDIEVLGLAQYGGTREGLTRVDTSTCSE